MNVSEAVKSRRAIKAYDVDHVMSDDDFKALMDLTLQSPSSFNLQHSRFVNVVDKDKRQAIRAVAWDQAQITDASVLLVLCADLNAWKKNPKTYWRNAPDDISDLMVSMIGPFYDGKKQLQRDEALRSVGISAQTLMLCAKEMGYDTCPMIGFDQDAVADILNLPDDHIIGMIVTIGKAAKDAFPRGGSIDYDVAVVKDTF